MKGAGFEALTGVGTKLHAAAGIILFRVVRR